MADITINQLSTKTNLATTNYLPISDGSVTTKLGTDSLFGFRNKIINGDMRVNQRYADSAITVNTGGPAYTLDRWYAYQNSPSTGVQVSRSSSAPSTFLNSLRWGRNGSGAAGGITVMGTVLETASSVELQGKTVALSFYARAGANFSSSGSALGVKLISGTGINQSVGAMVTFTWSGTTNPIDTSVTLTNSWQRFTLTATVPSNSNQLGLYFSWTTTGAAGADDNIYITGIQLEESATATPFERRPYTLEMNLCQRYYQLHGMGVNGNSSGYSVYFEGGIMFPVEMRRTPDFTLPITSIRIYFGGGYDQTNSGAYILQTQNISTKGCTFILGNWPQNNTFDQRGGRIRTDNCLAFDAEL